MKNIYCKHCDKYIDLKSIKCPLCGYQFSLKEIIPDDEVELWKNKTLSVWKRTMITYGVITMLLFLLSLIPFIGIVFIIIAIPFAIGFIISLKNYNKYSKQDFEEWRKEVSKSWKYQSATEKTVNVLKIAKAVKGLAESF